MGRGSSKKQVLEAKEILFRPASESKLSSIEKAEQEKHDKARKKI